MRVLALSNSYLEELSRVIKIGVGDSSYILSHEQASKVTKYLCEFPIILRTTAVQYDLLSVANEQVVPSSFRTDGEWVWGGAVEFYIYKYRVSPGLEFLEYLEKIDFQHRIPTEDAIRDAIKTVSG